MWFREFPAKFGIPVVRAESYTRPKFGVANRVATAEAAWDLV